MRAATLPLTVMAALPAALGGPPGWHQSYRAGYRDKAGAWAGGSEIMHIEPHGGVLYAFNGCARRVESDRHERTPAAPSPPYRYWVMCII